MKSRYYCILIPAFIMLVFCGCKSGSIQNETLQPADDVEVNSHAQDEKEKMLDTALKMSGKKITAEERNVALRMLNLNEDDLINGLNVFAELKFLDMSEYERKQKVQDIFFASAYYDKLQRQKKDVEYYGGKVTAKDNDKMDLSTENVLTKRLAELEK